MAHHDFCWSTALQQSITLNQHDPHHRFIQLASVTATGKPRNRTMVFRGLTDKGHSVLMCTDRRSAKLAEFLENSDAELCWYFLKSRQQYRLRGPIELVTEIKERNTLWHSLSEETKSQFEWPYPLMPVSTVKLTNDDVDRAIPNDISEHFVLFKVKVEEVDYLSLGTTCERVVCQTSAHGWTCSLVNP